MDCHRVAPGTLDAITSGMSEKHDASLMPDPSLDFTHFLSGRLGTDANTALSALGAFLLTFEPSWRRSTLPRDHGHLLSPTP